MKRATTLLLLPLLLSAPPVHGQEGDEFNPLGRDIPIEQMERQLRIQLEWIEMSHETMTEMLEDESGMEVDGRLSGNAGPLRESVKELIDEKDARILETAIVTARSGQRAKVESIAEFIYPTEYDPPSTVTGTEAKSPRIRLAPQATAFETRNLGMTLEVDPVLGADDRTIDLNLAPEIVYLVDQENYGSFDGDDHEVEVVMPTFYTMKTTTQITMIDGQYTFLGAHSPFNEDTLRMDSERKVLLFLKTDIVYVGLDLPEKNSGKKE
ncbi:MAG: hypothetical protein MI807_19595 [Verrucomicrobiales bacterium]|nr:hypothetical protein [Verrucomicrobiales bacterium]